MSHTFLLTTEAKGKPTTLKFRSVTPTTTEFEVTVLSEPELAPFTIKHEGGTWRLPLQLPEGLRTLEESLLEAAERFERR